MSINKETLDGPISFNFPPHKLITYLFDSFRGIVNKLHIDRHCSNLIDLRVITYEDDSNNKLVDKIDSSWTIIDDTIEYSTPTYGHFTVHIGSDVTDESYIPYISHVNQNGTVLFKHHLSPPIKQNDHRYYEHYKVMVSGLEEFIDYLENSARIHCLTVTGLFRGWLTHGGPGENIAKIINYIANNYPVYYLESFKEHNNLNFFIHVGESRELIHLEIDENKLNNQLVIKIVKGEYTPSDEEDTFKFTNFIPTPSDGKMEMKLLTFRSEKEEKLLDTMIKYFMKTETN